MKDERVKDKELTVATITEPQVENSTDDEVSNPLDEDTILVRKRDGRIADFDEYNINHAVIMALHEANVDIDDQVMEDINELTQEVKRTIIERYTQPVHIEDIQTLVEQGIIAKGWYEAAKLYSSYRVNRDIKRAQATDVNNAVQTLIRKDASLVNENANKDSNVYSTQRDLLAGAISKAEALKTLPTDVSNAHMKGDIHYHDADYSPFTPMTNCSLPNFKYMLAHGFVLGNAQMGSPHSIETAATQVTQIMQDVASSQYGGQTLNRADEVLAEYARLNYKKNRESALMIMPDGMTAEEASHIVARFKTNENKNLHIEDRPVIIDEPDETIDDDLEKQRDLYVKILTRKDIYDAIQTMEYQINSNRVSNGQTPFVTVGFGLGTDWFSREVTRCIFLIRILGLGSDHRTAIFPKLTYTIKHGINSEPNDPNYDLKRLALECSTKRMYPDILFYENIVKITGSFKAPMGCRSFLQGWVNPETGKDEEEGRMNLGVVTVNIPRIALESHGSIRKFWKLFNQRMEVAHHALEFRIQRSKQAEPLNAPTLWEYGGFATLAPHGTVDDAMKNSRSTISLGYIGLFEATSVFYGREWVNDYGWDEEAHDFAVSIIRRMTRLCKKWEKEEGYHYSVYGTPAESLTDKFARADKNKFGVVKGVTDHDFYTNSFHRPVWISGDTDKKPDATVKKLMKTDHWHQSDNGGAFSKLDFEEPFLRYSAGGHIVYVEYPSLRQNPDALEAVWDYAHEVGIDYLGSNSPIDHCFECGYEGDFQPTAEGYECPECGNNDPQKCDVTKRTCGYLGNPVQRPMIHGRHEELAHRVKEMQGETGKITLDNGDSREFYEDRALPLR
jgi:ribonucleoside-triphosphate reductase